MRRIIISAHVPKTGGTSFRLLLEQQFGAGFQPDYDWEPRPAIMDHPEIGGTDDDVRRSLRNVSCIHGHFSVHKYLRLIDIEGIDPVFITWLRDPVERAVSAYHFLRAVNNPQGARPVWEQQARSMTLEAFCRETAWNTNQQHQLLRFLPLEQFAFIGLTERYAESMQLFARLFCDGEMAARIPHERRNPNRTGARYDISEPVRDLLIASNGLDLQMHAYARGWLSGALQTAAVPPHDAGQPDSAVHAPPQLWPRFPTFWLRRHTRPSIAASQNVIRDR